MNTLLERLEKLEMENLRNRRSVRAMKFVTASAFAVLIAVSAIPSAYSRFFPPITIFATEYDLIGPNQNVTAKLETLNGGPNLVFFDNAGKVIAGVGVTNTSRVKATGMSVYDGNSLLAGTGVVRAAFGYGSAGPAIGQGVATYDASGNIRSAFGQALDGSSAYEVLYDSTGAERTGINIISGGLGFFVSDANGTGRARFGEASDGSQTNWVINDAAGGLGLSANVPADTATGASQLIAWDSNGNYRTVDEVDPIAPFAGYLTFDASETLTGNLP